MKANKKFIFTQTSAPFICGATIIGFCLLIDKYHPVNDRDLTLSDWFLFLLLFILMPLSMSLWGRILVFLGILTKEEAKGYPYSKPWGKDKLL